ncbi:hypothetical protein Ddye_027996 [Dipteronia dyeriana]|uniref:Cytochrome P450 n=1 Tax=Dipteronia dyeriana TaxID=168575 RepID=A0AAD9WR14_9ROSI|nr:hypothetical protein Ddye_027996 [Dipteronia dyeriana]
MLSGMRSKLLRHREELDEILENIIDEHRAASKVSMEKTSEDEADCLLDVLWIFRTKEIFAGGTESYGMGDIRDAEEPKSDEKGTSRSETANVELPLAQLLYHFDWKLPDGMKNQDIDMTGTFAITEKRKNDLYLIPTPHHPLPIE